MVPQRVDSGEFFVNAVSNRHGEGLAGNPRVDETVLPHLLLAADDARVEAHQV